MKPRRLFAFLATLALFNLKPSAHAAPGDADSLNLSITGSNVLAMVVQPDGKTIVGGNFSSVNGVVRNNIARLNADGTLDVNFDPNPDGQVLCAAVQADGKIILGGTFGALWPNGASTPTVRNSVARLNADGSLDLTFDPNPGGSSSINSVVLQEDGKILLGGFFLSLQPNGAPSFFSVGSVARVNADGTFDPTFDVGVNANVRCMVMQPDGKILLAGNFTSVRTSEVPPGILRPRIARVYPDGRLDQDFDPRANSGVFAVAVQTDGKILLGGSFTTLQPNGAGASITRHRIARVHEDGSLDAGFNPTANDTVYSLAVQADGKMLIGGDFTTLQPSGAAVPTELGRIARLNANGSLDLGFDPKADNTVFGTTLHAGGRVLLGGSFAMLQPNGATTGTGRSLLAQLHNDAATQILAASDGVQVKWERGGATPEFSRVTFEVSVDGGSNWSLLGMGSRVGATATWQHSAHELPVSGHLRARGVSTGGYFNGSSGLIEQVAAFSDDTTATPILTAPASFSVTKSPVSVDFTLPEAAMPGSLKMIFGGSIFTLADTLGTSGQHTFTFDPANPLASSAVASIAGSSSLLDGFYTVVLRYQDTVGNAEAIVTSTSVEIDTATQAPTLSQVTSAPFQGRTISVSFVLPEPVLGGSVKLFFDNGTVQPFTLGNAFAVPGPRTLSFDPDAPMASGFFASASALADGTYSVSLAYQDAVGNAVNSSAAVSGVVVGSTIQPGTLEALDANITGSGAHIYATAVQPDGKIIIGGAFTAVGGVARLNIARLHADGTLDMGFDPQAGGSVYGNPVGFVTCVAVQPDGKVLVGGDFTSFQPNGAASSTERRGIARLHADGTLDTGFDPKASSPVFSFAIQPDEKIIVGGNFTTLQPNGAASPTLRFCIARLNANGTLDLGFDPKVSHSTISAIVTSVALQPDGKVLLGGFFESLQPNGTASSTPRHHIARVNADGTLDPTFDPNPSSFVNAVALQADGKILLGGDFTSLQPAGAPSPTSRQYIARVNADGTMDAGFDPTPNTTVESIVVQTDGQVIFSGFFTSVQPNGAALPVTRNFIARVQGNGTLDNDFDPNPDQRIESIAVQADGKVLLGGYFTTLQPNGAASPTSRRLFARLANGPATQTLTVPDATKVQWQRSGAGPEVTHVIFQRSFDDGATWATLGSGARVAGGWELTGLNLNNQFGLIRAVGHAAGGEYNGSAGLVAQTASYDFDTVPVGNATYLGEDIISTGNVLSGRYVTIPSPGVLVSFGAIFGSSGTQGNLALYRMDGDFGRPGTLVAQTGAFTVTGGVKEVAAIGTPIVEAGTYYLTSIYSDFTILGAAPMGTNTQGFFRNPYGFTGNLPGFLNEGNLTNQLRVANLYLRLGTLSSTPTLTKPASNFATKTNFDVDFTLPQPAQAGSLTLTFAGAVTRTFTLAGSLLGAGQHGFNFNPADPIGTSSGAIAIANVNDLPEGFYNVTLGYRNLNNEGPGTAVSGNVVFDKTAPQLTRPTTFTAEATAANGAMVDFSAEVFAIDNVDPAPTVIGTPANGTLFPIGNTTVNVTATDVAGNETTGSFTVKVQDTTAPQFVSPTPTGTLTFEAALSFSSSGGTAVNFDLVATDLVDASPEIVLTAGLPSGSIFPLGGTTVAFKATDDSGNSVTGDLQVVITDTTAPMLTAPTGTLTVEATSAAGAAVTFSATATDIADPAPVVVATPASGSTFPFGSTTVNVTATDASQNQTTAMFTVFVQDATGPVIATHPNVSVLAPGLGGVVVNYAAATATDATGVDTITYSKESGTIFPLGTTTVTVNATDTLGNPATPVTFDVIVHLAAPQSTVVRAKGSEAPGRGTNGLPSEAILASFGVPAIDDLGNVAFTAKWTSDDGKVKGSGLFTDDACLAIVGGDASSIATSAKFKSFGDPVISEGSIAVIAGLTAKATPSVVLSNVAVATTLEAVARVGDVAPDKDGVQPTGGAKFKTFKGVAIDGGAVLIFAQLIGGTGTEKTTPANDLGLWMKVGPNALRRVLRENDSVQVQDVPLVTRKIKTLVSFGAGNGSPGAGRGWLAQPYDFMALARVTFDDKSQAVLASTSTGNIQIYSLSGVAGMGGPAITDATFASYSFPATNDGYNVAFLGSLTVGAGGVTKVDARGVFVSNGAGAYTALARVGGNAPGTDAKFSVLKDPVLDDGEGVTFPATIKGGTAKGLGLTTLWWRPSMGTLTLLAQGGPTTLGVSHDLPVGAQWKSFTSLAVASNRGPLFTGTLVPKKGSVTAKDANGVWAMDFEGKLRTLFRTGATNIINGKTLASFKLLSATVGSTGVPRSFTATQKIVWLATFTDKSQAIVTTEVP